MQSRAEDVINAYEVMFDVATKIGELRQQVDEKLEQWYRKWPTIAQAAQVDLNVPKTCRRQWAQSKYRHQRRTTTAKD